MHQTRHICTVFLAAVNHIALWTDCRFRRISNRLILSGSIGALLVIAAEGPLFGDWMSIWKRLAAGGAAGLLHGLPYLSRRLGAGDLKLAVVTGILLGWARWTVYLYYYGWVLGAAAVILLAVPLKYRSSSLPMALFMAVSLDLYLLPDIGL